MANHIYALPILPGKLEKWRRFCQELLGVHYDAFQDSRERLGILQESAWYHSLPTGDLVILYLEGIGPEEFFTALAESKHIFDRWLWEQLLDIHGKVFYQNLEQLAGELVFDVRFDNFHTEIMAPALKGVSDSTEFSK